MLNDGPLIISTDVAKGSVYTTLRANNRGLAAALGIVLLFEKLSSFSKILRPIKTLTIF